MNRFLYFLFGFILVVVLIALFWAVKTHDETVRSLPDILARDFQPLLAGSGITDVNIGEIGKRVHEIRTEYPYVEEIIVRKITRSGDEFTVYPYAYNLDHPRFDNAIDETYFTQAVLGSSGQALGALYIKISAQRSRLFYAAIAGSISALILVIGLGVYQIRTQEEEVRKTSSLLEEKQRELIHLERLALVGQVTANLLHDLKKPVLNIRAEAESMPTQPARDTILDETDLFLGMLRELQLEGFLRRDLEKAEFLDIGEILSRSQRLVKYAQENVEVDFQMTDNLPFIFGQRHQLIQVFSNILLNAFQALEGEGRVLISVTQVVEQDESWLEVAITDNGPGMPYDVITHIFEPFYSTRKQTEATGLGLYITKTIIESMGGTIIAHSIPKHGTTFTIRFPISSEEME